MARMLAMSRPISAARSAWAEAAGRGPQPASQSTAASAPASIISAQVGRSWYDLDCMRVWLLLLLVLHMSVSAQDRTQARSMVISDRGIVATSQTLASQAGAQVLARGGSAIDAAIAANAALSVVEPERAGRGGERL